MYPQTLTEYDHFLHLNGHGHTDTLTFQANLSGNQLQVIMVHHPGDRSLRGPGRFGICQCHDNVFMTAAPEVTATTIRRSAKRRRPLSVPVGWRDRFSHPETGLFPGSPYDVPMFHMVFFHIDISWLAGIPQSTRCVDKLAVNFLQMFNARRTIISFIV